MEMFENEALANINTDLAPLWWYRYVDDTNTAIRKDKVKEFHDYINSRDSCIQFTMEQPEADGSIPFLDTKVTPLIDGKVKTTVYRKPTHTDLYLQWNSNHALNAKLSVPRSLFNRAENVCTNQEDRKKEFEHISHVLKENGFPTWARSRSSTIKSTKDKQRTINQEHSNSKCFIVIPYIEGTSERIRNTLQKRGIQTYFKSSNTLRDILVKPKDKNKKENMKDVIYQIDCATPGCNAYYIGETSRPLRERFEETQEKRSISYISESKHKPPELSSLSVKVRDKEQHADKRRLLEVMFINVNNPPLNANVGKYEIPPIYGDILRVSGQFNVHT
ncbi:uncharacterized protein [Ptychodera flava]|uniref:uncharacterized protein n=1 Tax=Ptychodera flava TaxID=63121 RepID=UPI00396A01BA